MGTSPPSDACALSSPYSNDPLPRQGATSTQPPANHKTARPGNLDLPSSCASLVAATTCPVLLNLAGRRMDSFLGQAGREARLRVSDGEPVGRVPGLSLGLLLAVCRLDRFSNLTYLSTQKTARTPWRNQCGHGSHLARDLLLRRDVLRSNAWVTRSCHHFGRMLNSMFRLGFEGFVVPR